MAELDRLKVDIKHSGSASFMVDRPNILSLTRNQNWSRLRLATRLFIQKGSTYPICLRGLGLTIPILITIYRVDILEHVSCMSTSEHPLHRDISTTTSCFVHPDIKGPSPLRMIQPHVMPFFHRPDIQSLSSISRSEAGEPLLLRLA
jgi:hypothetical protein